MLLPLFRYSKMLRDTVSPNNKLQESLLNLEIDDDNTVFQQANSSQSTCADFTKAYLSIIITVLPQWALITTLIVFVLLAFHNSLKAAKIYDNCSKNSAQYRYYVELRTGDTSSSYSRRRTTLYIDMFDDNQVTLAKVAIPGHVIFGKKDSAVQALDDEKYFELRVSRFWLYRATRLKRVATIRITHTCTEGDARIMVYGVEIRSSEGEKNKLFFPVMSHISAYGQVNKPNACFDVESTGSISNMGGSHFETSSVSAQLSWVDLSILAYFLSGLIYSLSLFEWDMEGATRDWGPAIAKGALIGVISFAITLLVGLFIRYYIKATYYQKIGVGFWASIYYFICLFLLAISTACFIYTAYQAYYYICPKQHGWWILTLVVAIILSSILACFTALITWAIALCNSKSGEQYILPDDTGYTNNSHPEPPSRRGSHQRVGSKQQMMSQQHQGWSPVPIHMMMQPPQTSYMPYGQMIMPAQSPLTPSYKTMQTGYGPSPGGYDVPPHTMMTGTPTIATAATQASPSPSPNYHQQTTATGVNLQGIKATKKIGSNESTGSTYYQQLMKTKGGVKSISQYGELLKAKKGTKGNK